MPRALSDTLWAEALIVLARNTSPQAVVFRPTTSGWEPPVDVVETETELVVVVALPGVARSDIEIVLGGGALLVRGTRRWNTVHASSRIHRMELPHGRFERRLPLPHGSYQLAGQDHVDGCLHLTLRRLG